MAGGGLFGAHVLERAEDDAGVGEEGLAGEIGVEGFGEAEVDDLGDGEAFDGFDEDVGGLDIAVDDALLVGVVDGLADGDEEFDALAGGEVVAFGVGGDGESVDELHDEEGEALGGGAGVEDLSDVGVVHEGEGAAFGVEAGDDGFGAHAGFDDFEGDVAADGFGLCGEIDGAHAAFAEDALDFVVADGGGGGVGGGEEIGGAFVGGEELGDLFEEGGVIGAGVG